MTYETIGKTVLGNDIIMFKIGNPNEGKVLFDGAMHGIETLGSELLYFYAKWLLTSNEPLAQHILSATYTMLIPALNVDKYNRDRKNANGVDLNRNFATNWDNSGSTNPDSDTYRGPSPLSEPESQTLIRVFITYTPHFYVNLHMWAGPYYAGSYYGNKTYYQILRNKINSLSRQHGVSPFYYTGQFRGAGFAISDASRTGITSFLIELSETAMPYTDIEKNLLPRFIPIAAVLSQESEIQTFFEDSFESKNFDCWSDITITSGANASVSNIKSYEGLYSARFETEAIISGTKRACIYKNIDKSAIVYARGYFYLEEGLPLTDNDDRFTLIQFLNSNGGIIANLQIRHVHGEDRFTILALGNMITTTAIYPQPKTWYCLELYIKIHSTKGEIKAYINGVEHLSYVNIDTNSLGNVSVIRFGLAISINIQHKVTVYCDSAAINTSYIGPRPFPHWDVNQDGIVNILDIGIVAAAYGSNPQTVNWNSAADLNFDEIVDIFDICIIAIYFGERYI
jgi:hypothetical protein